LRENFSLSFFHQSLTQIWSFKTREKRREIEKSEKLRTSTPKKTPTARHSFIYIIIIRHQFSSCSSIKVNGSKHPNSENNEIYFGSTVEEKSIFLKKEKLHPIKRKSNYIKQTCFCVAKNELK
jgi:hypothetical protein